MAVDGTGTGMADGVALKRIGLAEGAPDLTRYPTHDEMTGLLRAWADRYPDLIALDSLGRSPEGRELWSVTLTDRTSGAPEDKPAVYLEGNIHAGEVLPSVVCLATIWDLASRFGHDEEATDLLHTRTFYVRPRVAPDGAERYLTTPDRLRSAPIAWPHAERQPGLHPEDVDGDGHATVMRISDPNGEWRASALDDRIMVRCGPGEPPGGRYRLVQEGHIEGPVADASADPMVAPTFWGLDFNRSFPHNWQPEYRQTGAGPYPLYPVETRATADFFLAHPNIGVAILYHTFGGFVFTLPSSVPASTYRHGDLGGDYRVLTEAFTRITGQPAFQSYDEATDTARSGSLMDWAYSQHGIYTWVPELWDIYRASGVRDERPEGYPPLSEEEDLALLSWVDDEFTDGEAGFLPWRPFDHPQLGPVDIGGWTYKYTHQNCPGRVIPSIARPVIDWSYLVARALPQLAIERLDLEPLGNGLWSLTVTVVNEGFLPTNVSMQARDVRRAEPVSVRVAGDGIEAVSGELVADLGHLEGESGATDVAWRGPVAARRHGTARFVLRVPPGIEHLHVGVSSPRAGTALRRVDLATDAER
ncbi:MAG: hypothetical protein AVDCRST_MAG49-4438 [uncultured Thermomicrobiales bacterium]|uniref:Peptidase M14 domain-containing protein n=1 Tax=uncultured Thermomicrobiales bacterium TaxID=1645740 RepID=A0A6J4VJX6_9BACT|nr:MAG: hypothetical protein AVDCRST_MAG49-4438 [uncultured Thermomicrobiales bacterium]